MAEEVKLAATLARPKMLANANPQLNYVLLEVIPVGEGLPQSAPLNVCLVLDRSGSMAGQKMENLRRAVELVIDQLDPTDILSIVIFDDRAEILVPATSVTDKNTLKAKSERASPIGADGDEQGDAVGHPRIAKAPDADACADGAADRRTNLRRRR